MKKLVAVVGAGASHELGLPVGAKLKATIAELLRLSFDEWGRKLTSGDVPVCEALRLASGNNSVNSFWSEVQHIADAMPQAYSIDHFINDHRGNKNIELCGKIGIARAILKSEKTSSIFLKIDASDSHINFSKTENTWLNHFARLITQGCTVDDLPEKLSQIGLIVFNYDRCIEHFLNQWLQVYYRLSQPEAARILENLQVLHPYGTVGRLPWQMGNGSAIPFGAEVSPTDLLAVSQQIKTFTEGTDPSSSEICAIRDCIATARTLLFLGFAYYDLNLDLLAPENHPALQNRTAFGTAFGISEFDRRAIASELARRFQLSVSSVHLSPLECHNIFSEYNRGISFSEL